MASENPDLHIISVIDDEVDETEKFSSLVKPAAGEIVPMDSALVSLINSMERLERLKGKKAPPFVIGKEKELIRKYRHAACLAMGKEVVDMIINSKAKVHLLIDSVGGNGVAGQPYDSLLERAADSAAYVTREASSLACNLLLVADRGYCLKDSYVMWHLGRPDQDDFDEPEDLDEEADPAREIFQRECDDETWGIFMAMMNSRCREEKRDEMNRKLDASVDADRREVVFSGKELADYGIITEAFDTTRQLMEKFFLETGIKPGDAQKSLPLRQFFDMARFSAAVSRISGINCSFMFDRGRGGLKFRVVRGEDDTAKNRKFLRKLADALLAKGRTQA